MYVSVPSSDISGHWPYEDGPLANNSGSKPNSREHERSWQAVQICDVMFLALHVLPKSCFAPLSQKTSAQCPVSQTCLDEDVFMKVPIG
jgi:hypothetical protein